MSVQTAPRRRGRPVLGAIAGLLFGLFVALDLQQFGVRPLDNISVIGLPLAGLVIGIVLAYTAPFKRGTKESPPERTGQPETGN